MSRQHCKQGLTPSRDAGALNLWQYPGHFAMALALALTDIIEDSIVSRQGCQVMQKVDFVLKDGDDNRGTGKPELNRIDHTNDKKRNN